MSFCSFSIFNKHYLNMANSTKVSSLVPMDKLKPIELTHYVNDSQPLESGDMSLSAVLDTRGPDGRTIKVGASTLDWLNVKLISKGVEFDVIACWNTDDITCIAVYLGHWNDGVLA